MFSFSISCKSFNQLQKRLLSLPLGDKDSASCSFVLESEVLKVFFNSKVDKGESCSLFYEEIPVSNLSGKASIASILVSNFYSLKIPETIEETKYPQCENVSFTFTDAVLSLEYEVRWNRHTAPSKNRLNFAVLSGKTDLKDYEQMFDSSKKEIINLQSAPFLEAVQQVSFIKSDISSRDTNGCFFEFKDTTFWAIATDSSIAVRYKGTVPGGGLGKHSFVVSNPILALVKTFIGDAESFVIVPLRSSLLIETSGRKLLIPKMSGSYIIKDHETFFNVQTMPFIACLDLKPMNLSLSNLNAKAADTYKRVTLNFEDLRFSMKSQIDTADNIPCTVTAGAKININGDFLGLVGQRLATLDLFSKLYFDKSTDKVGFTTDENDKLSILVQGLSF